MARHGSVLCGGRSDRCRFPPRRSKSHAHRQLRARHSVGARRAIRAGDSLCELPVRLVRSFLVLSLLLVAAAGCDSDFLSGLDGDDPSGLQYSLVDGSTPGVPAGILLRWQPPRDRVPTTYAVYGRASLGAEWYLVGITTSPTFHDAGPAQRQYYVAARDDEDVEFGETRPVTVEALASLPTPEGLTSVSLDRAVHLTWSDNARRAAPSRFHAYRVYATAYSATRGCASDGWQLEGMTVSSAFLSTELGNGVTRCFAVTALSRDGVESAMSRSRSDTPRPDGRHVVIDAFELRPATAGFVFHDVVAGTFGRVVDGGRADADFRVERTAEGGMRLRTTRADVRFALYGDAPVGDLRLIDVAPTTGYVLSTVDVVPGHAYAVRIVRADGARYGVVRAAYVTATHLVVDWAYQTAPGNPELSLGSP